MPELPTASTEEEVTIVSTGIELQCEILVQI